MFCTFSFSKVFLFGACSLALLAAPHSARADNLDAALLKEGHPIVEKLNAKKIKSVGVLQFRVKVGNKTASWNGGPITQILPELLEAALIEADLDDSLNILRRPTQQAAAKFKTASLDNEKDRGALFTHALTTYSKDGAAVKADAFLTGQVELREDAKKVTVVLNLFDKDNTTVRELHRFTFDADYAILADCGVGFSLSTRLPSNHKHTRSHLETVLQSETLQLPVQKPDEKFPVEISIQYDGVEQPLQTDVSGVNLAAAKSHNRKIDAPKEGQKVTIVVKNLQETKIGLVLMVGGKSTLYEVENFRESGKWVLEPGKTYTLRGFYQPGDDKHKEFDVLSKENSEALFKEKGDAAGQIVAYVYQPGTEEVVAMAKTRGFSLRQPQDVRSRKVLSQAEMLEVIKEARKNGLKAGGRGAIAPGAEKINVKLENSDLEAVVTNAAMIIIYNSK